jgi:hypothetical protein
MSKMGYGISFLKHPPACNSSPGQSQKSLFELTGTYESGEQAYDILVGLRFLCSTIPMLRKKVEDIEDTTAAFCLFWEKA